MHKEKTQNAVEVYYEDLFRSIKTIESRHGSLLAAMSLDEDYNNIDSILQTMDILSQIYSYYAKLFHDTNERLGRAKDSYVLWRSNVDKIIRDKLFKRNKDDGMTATAAKPTPKDIDNYFSLKYQKKHPTAIKYETTISKLEHQLSNLRIMRDTADRRITMMQSAASFLGKCVDRGLITPRVMQVKSKRKITRRKFAEED